MSHGSPAAAGAPRVLLVEDSVDLARALSRLLGRHGFEVEVAHDLAAALALLAPGKRWDAVVVDGRLPDGDGRALAPSLRERPELARATLVLVSGEGTAGAVPEGFDHALVKPVGLGRLVELLRGAGSRSEGRAGADPGV